MYTAEVRTEEGTCTLQTPTIEAMFLLVNQLNEDIFVKDTQISAKNGKMPGKKGYFSGYTLSGLRAVYERN